MSTAEDEPDDLSGRSGGAGPARGWQDAAACAGRPELFDVADDPDAVRRAVAVCAGCPVLSACRRYALAHDVAGVCGGLTRDQRSRWQRRRAISFTGTGEFLPRDVEALDELTDADCQRRGQGTAANRARRVALLANRGHTAAGIAELMGLSVRSVNRLLEIAVHHLRVELDPAALITVAVTPPRSIAGRGIFTRDTDVAGSAAVDPRPAA